MGGPATVEGGGVMGLGGEGGGVIGDGGIAFAAPQMCIAAIGARQAVFRLELERMIAVGNRGGGIAQDRRMEAALAIDRPGLGREELQGLLIEGQRLVALARDGHGFRQMQPRENALGIEFHRRLQILEGVVVVAGEGIGIAAACQSSRHPSASGQGPRRTPGSHGP